jgi:hypothetical protein
MLGDRGLEEIGYRASGTGAVPQAAKVDSGADRLTAAPLPAESERIQHAETAGGHD